MNTFRGIRLEIPYTPYCLFMKSQKAKCDSNIMYGLCFRPAAEKTHLAFTKRQRRQSKGCVTL
ncbi:uncharacterized protein AKAW2_10853S [Aspergillus luchuensis]|uniref:Uncharacterized protein n=1 Tax=Aspergillus kawachii TaxID=1069201 RepID=A0A7R7VZW5_ASPKA|nr:uncharacterized protein AKAW2_10853S [Aspergillus luchuensis]BCR93807.1 hypothetical protein AKAW2_10853S [Aspergillus luchuensis]